MSFQFRYICQNGTDTPADLHGTPLWSMLSSTIWGKGKYPEFITNTLLVVQCVGPCTSAPINKLQNGLSIVVKPFLSTSLMGTEKGNTWLWVCVVRGLKACLFWPIPIRAVVALYCSLSFLLATILCSYQSDWEHPHTDLPSKRKTSSELCPKSWFVQGHPWRSSHPQFPIIADKHVQEGYHPVVWGCGTHAFCARASLGTLF